MAVALTSGKQVKVMEAISGPGFDLVWVLWLAQSGFCAIFMSYTRLVWWRAGGMAVLGTTWLVICGLMIDDGLWYVTTFISPVVAGYSFRAAWFVARGTYGE